MSHYFINDDSLVSNKKKIDVSILGTSFVLYTDNGVFSKDNLDYGTKHLLESICLNGNETILDVGCGYGPIGIYLAKAYPNTKIVMTDVLSRAIELTKDNLALNNITNASVFLSYLYEKIDDRFDIIISNPPIRAGKVVLNELFVKAIEHLSEQGVLYLVIRKDQGADSHIKTLKQHYRDVSVVNKKKGYCIIKASI